MRRLLLALLFAPLLAAPGSDPVAADLWRKATSLFAQFEGVYPSRMSVRTEMLDRGGKATAVTEMRFVNTLREDGVVESELVSAFEDGRDVTAGRRARREERRAGDGKQARISLSDSPFNPERQERLELRPHPERALISGRSCRRFDFSYRPEIEGLGKGAGVVQRGMAWLEEESGRPLKLEYTLVPLPRRVKRLWTVCLFETEAGGAWVMREMRVEGQGGILFIRKGFRLVTRFEEYLPVGGG